MRVNQKIENNPTLSRYSFLSRLLHYCAFGIPFVSRASFEVEKTYCNFGPQKIKDKNPIFISGLPRSGTSVLLQALYKTDKLTSLTYRDMPFVLMPTLWRRISRSFYRKSQHQERAHGDKLEISFDSPEAFEEVFWRVFYGKNYIHKNGLFAHQLDSEMIDEFRSFVACVLNKEAGDANKTDLRYLSKNNNNILRIDGIKKAFPDSYILIPFRDPIAQSTSLMWQHQKFCDLHDKNSFSRRYMKWLGHFEFGRNHLPVIFKNEFSSRLKQYTPEQIEYWLLLWIQTYQYLSENFSDTCLFIHYEKLCENPDQYLSTLLNIVDVEFPAASLAKLFRSPVKHPEVSINSELREEALAVFENLKTGSQIIF